MENNEQLERFFDQMKKQDKRVEIPAFPEVKSRKFNFWIPAGIAASMSLAFLFIPKPSAIEEPTPEVVIITLQEDENQNQHFTIEESTFLDTWESPTASLLTEY
ncbi:hypothetical protein PBT90_00970 [Algoriphagus halophytocola]|uniref:Anti-sigma factor n=1 Tax=Algoriphagus halophytocola TaxID=2991499 RepID=A0ABY6MIL3_9BACT|nr:MULTISPECIES: hypothetical protein [unclassified Algoriphagus]UZD22029.1 hypothetical protein OM944_15295 [Algoriphagus sp. TR-M5]WBL43280.1 hypothetical protein PBT90_00970 [Algoriphagus sp. TR-M9]